MLRSSITPNVGRLDRQPIRARRGQVVLRPERASETSPGQANIVSAALGIPNGKTLCPEGAPEMWSNHSSLRERSVKTPVPLQGTKFNRQQTQGGARSTRWPWAGFRGPLGAKTRTAQLLNSCCGLLFPIGAEPCFIRHDCFRPYLSSHSRKLFSGMNSTFDPNWSAFSGDSPSGTMTFNPVSNRSPLG